MDPEFIVRRRRVKRPLIFARGHNPIAPRGKLLNCVGSVLVTRDQQIQYRPRQFRELNSMPPHLLLKTRDIAEECRYGAWELLTVDEPRHPSGEVEEVVHEAATACGHRV